MRLTLLPLCFAFGLAAQSSYYLGALGGSSALSADGRSVVSGDSAAVSSYKPETGAAFQIFGGRNLRDFLAVQGNYVWNRNGLTLSSVDSRTNTFYEQTRTSAQQDFSADLLVFFRNRRSRIRPYLSIGAGVVRLDSRAERLIAAHNAPPLPPAQFTSAGVALRSPVGIDIRMRARWYFRFSFTEIIRANAISAQLSPRGQRNLANFQNLFGFFRTF